jgi:hypothetical protein
MTGTAGRVPMATFPAQGGVGWVYPLPGIRQIMFQKAWQECKTRAAPPPGQGPCESGQRPHYSGIEGRPGPQQDPKGTENP